MENISNKKIGIVGLGISGFAAALLAKKKKADVYISEAGKGKKVQDYAAILRKKGIKVEIGGHSEAFFQGVDSIITSPGVKNKAMPLVWAKKNNIPIVSEIEFASWFCPLPIIAITGSNGKTTVTTLIGKVLKDSGKRVIVCGNIGNPFSAEVSRFKQADVVVLEVSSFQLEYIQSFRPKVSIILNVTQNHLDHHNSMSEYFKAKAQIIKNQKKTDFTILNSGDSRVRKIGKQTKAKVLFFGKKKKNSECVVNFFGQSWLQGQIIVSEFKKKKYKFNSAELKIKGTHNLENVMVVILAAKTQGVKNKSITDSLRQFDGLEHRCERIKNIRGVNFINDSKSTTVDATRKALSMFSRKDVILICGGRDKGSNFIPIRQLVGKKVFRVVLIGEAADKIKKAWGNIVPMQVAPDFTSAVKSAYEQARDGDSVLLSPMCASFDMFKSFEHRGDVFRKEVLKIDRKLKK
ncbi:MAG: UDP-N-acetylmuramoyl-L-alanine--D-glutamate ligase [PVC group bacterium]|nr:UDP-N-acetylmuramoyl-L-alanine--D-glutamate ligase [PVC group bacterium]